MIIAWFLGYFLIVIAIEVEAQRGNVHFASNVEENDEIHDNFDENENGGNIDGEQQYQPERTVNTNTIPGVPGVDYPTYETIPKTSFTCQGKVESAYYADIETQCQVFHICQSGGQRNSFLCPVGSIFNQKYSVCDWWYSFDCDSVNEIGSHDFDIQKTGNGDENYQNEIQQYENLQDQYNNYNNNNYNPNPYSDLSIASSGGNNPKDEQPKSSNKQRNNFKKTRNTVREETNQINRTAAPAITTIKPYIKKLLNRKQASGGDQKINPQTSNVVNKQQQLIGNNESKFISGSAPAATNDTNSTNTSIFNGNNIGGEYTSHQQQHQYPNPYRNGLNGYSNGNRVNGAKPIGFLLASTGSGTTGVVSTSSGNVPVNSNAGVNVGGDTFGDNTNNSNNAGDYRNYNSATDEQKYTQVT